MSPHDSRRKCRIGAYLPPLLRAQALVPSWDISQNDTLLKCAAMSAKPESDPLSELRAIKREYEAALKVAIDTEEKWRLREMVRKIEASIRELEQPEGNS